jgi:hypothetical protein
VPTLRKLKAFSEIEQIVVSFDVKRTPNPELLDANIDVGQDPYGCDPQLAKVKEIV